MANCIHINSQIKNLMKHKKRVCIFLLYLFLNAGLGMLSYVYMEYNKSAAFESSTYDFIFIFGPGLFFCFPYVFIVIIFLNPLFLLIYIIPHIILYPVFYQLFSLNREYRLIAGFAFIILWFFAGHFIFNIMIDVG